MKIEVKGAIIPNDQAWIYDWYEMDYTSPKLVNQAIKEAKKDEELEVIINSGGGSVFAGFEIYTALKDYKGDVTVKVVGIAGSSASVIMLAGKKVMISPPAQVMIHNVSGTFQGDYNDMQLAKDILEGLNQSIANVYQLKTGLKNEELLEMMNKETWLTAQKAKELNFVDEIMFTDNKNSFTNSLGTGYFLLPENVINKMRNEFKGDIPKFEKVPIPENNIAKEQLDLAVAKLNLLFKI